jgi:hypothetical protein
VLEKIDTTDEKNTCIRDLNLGQESIRIFDNGCDGKIERYTVTTFDETIRKYRTTYYECDGRPDEYGFCPIYRKSDIRINSTSTNLMDYGENNESSTNDLVDHDEDNESSTNLMDYGEDNESSTNDY